VVWDSLGTITAFRLTAGNVNECTAFVALMESVSVPSGHGRPRKRPRRLAGDKGYSTRAIRAWCSKHNVRAVIPERRDQIEQRKRRPGRKPAFDREQYRRRNIVERAVGWLKNQRRIATRSEKRAVHYESMITIALVGRYATKLSDTT
jgi:transposase